MQLLLKTGIFIDTQFEYYICFKKIPTRLKYLKIHLNLFINHTKSEIKSWHLGLCNYVLIEL